MVSDWLLDGIPIGTIVLRPPLHERGHTHDSGCRGILLGRSPSHESGSLSITPPYFHSHFVLREEKTANFNVLLPFMGQG